MSLKKDRITIKWLVLFYYQKDTAGLGQTAFMQSDLDLQCLIIKVFEPDLTEIANFKTFVTDLNNN